MFKDIFSGDRLVQKKFELLNLLGKKWKVKNYQYFWLIFGGKLSNKILILLPFQRYWHSYGLMCNFPFLRSENVNLWKQPQFLWMLYFRSRYYICSLEYSQIQMLLKCIRMEIEYFVFLWKQRKVYSKYLYIQIWLWAPHNCYGEEVDDIGQ